MAKFCTRCGRPLEEGEVCSCQKQNKADTDSVAGFWETMKNRMGIGDPELNKSDAYEVGKQIIPDCVKANESEIPVKQYKIATLRNRILGIPYSKAIGRLQVTNKRVIFRAPGKCLAGRTTLQHEFSIDEIAGIESRREFIFNIWDLIIGILAAFVGGAVALGIIFSMCRNSVIYEGKIFGAVLLTLIVGIAASIPFYTVKQKWLVKVLCLGASVAPFFSVGKLLAASGRSPFWSKILLFLSFMSLIDLIAALILNTIKPNLVLVVKTKAASDAVDIRRKRTGLFGISLDKEDHTGYTEILPEQDAEKSIREIGALINDIQKLGDFGVEKWKN